VVVRGIESRQQGLAAQVDDFSLVANLATNIRGRADGRDLAAPNGHRFRHVAFASHRNNGRIQQHGIGGRLGLRPNSRLPAQDNECDQTQSGSHWFHREKVCLAIGFPIVSKG
jgi:hypothetical protein